MDAWRPKRYSTDREERRRGMRNISFHPDAAANFNRKGEDLLSEIRPVEQRDRPKRFQPDVFVAGELKTTNYLRLEQTQRATRRITAIVFSDGHQEVGLVGDDCKKLTRLAEDIRKTQQFRHVASYSFVKKTILDWAEQRVRKEAEGPLIDFILSRTIAAVGLYEAWIPIARLHLETEVELGPVTFRTITKELLESLFVELTTSRSEEERMELEAWFQREWQALRGLAAATITLEAEESYTIEVALQEAERATALLCIFHEAHLSPLITSYCRPIGKQNEESYRAILKKDGQRLSFNASTLEPGPAPWILSRDELKLIESVGFDALRELISMKKKSEFQEKLLDALLLYSKSTTAKEPAEKLVFILVALESLLLKDEREAVQQNIGERLAFVVGQSAKERREIVKIVTDCYNLRSRFLYHGRDVKDFETFTIFMGHAWTFFSRLIRCHKEFSSQKEMFETIEELKFSTP
jgi:hypothetical protein